MRKPGSTWYFLQPLLSHAEEWSLPSQEAHQTSPLFFPGKATDVGGPVPEILGSAWPPFQHHTTQSQEVSGLPFPVGAVHWRSVGFVFPISVVVAPAPSPRGGKSWGLGGVRLSSWAAQPGRWEGFKLRFPPFSSQSHVQVLLALHHLEHQGRHPRWPQHHWGEDEWHLCQRVSLLTAVSSGYLGLEAQIWQRRGWHGHVTRCGVCPMGWRGSSSTWMLVMVVYGRMRFGEAALLSGHGSAHPPPGTALGMFHVRRLASLQSWYIYMYLEFPFFYLETHKNVATSSNSSGTFPSLPDSIYVLSRVKWCNPSQGTHLFCAFFGFRHRKR